MKYKICKLWRQVALGLTLMGVTGTLFAQTVTTVGGASGSTYPGPYSGYLDGQYTRFKQPSGLAMDPAGNILFIADYSNNVVRFMTSPGSSSRQTYTFTNSINPSITRGITNPIAVAVDLATNVYVLNRGNGTNGTLLQFNINYLGYPTLVVTNASRLTNATAMVVDGLGNIFVTVQSNTVLRVTPPNTVSIVGVITNRGVNLQGIAVMDNDQLALSDAGTNSGIWLLDTYSTNINNNATKLAGFNGTGDNSDVWPVPATNAIFNHPANIAKAGNGMLVITDNGNHRVKLLDTIYSTVTLLYGVRSNLWLTGQTILIPGGSYKDPGGWVDGNATNILGGAESRLPFGAVVAPDGSVYVSEDYCHVIRHVTGTSLSGPVPGYPRSGVAGIGLDPSGNYLYIASPANNQVRVLNIPANQTSTFLTAADGLNNPVSVLSDTNGSYDGIYYIDVLNAGTNGSILEFDNDGNAYGPIITGLNQPTAFTMDGNGNLFVAEQGGAIKVVIASTGTSNTIATITTNANVQLQGIAILDNGNIAVSDAGNHVIWSVNPLTKLISILTGQLGTNGTTIGPSNFAKLYQPHQLARSGSQLLAADSGNSRLVLVSARGTTSTNLNPNNATLWFGNSTDPVTSGNSRFLAMNTPIGVAVSPAGIIYDSEPTNQVVRGLTTPTNPPPAIPVVPLPFFSAVAGIALNSLNTELFITDPTNSTVSILDLANNLMSVFLDSSSGIYQPVDVALDTSDNVYVLNQGTGGNGSILQFDQYGNLLATVAASLSMPTAMKMDFSGNIFVSELNGAVQEFYAGGSNTTLVTITTNANVRLQGITLLDNGSVVVSDAGNQVLWKIAPGATNAVLFTGVFGSAGTNFGGVGSAKLNQPMRLAETFGGLLIVDSGNNRILVCDDSGTVSKALKSTNALVWFGSPVIDPVASTSPYFVTMQSPVGVAIGTSGTNGIVFDSETIYKDIRGILNTGIKAPISPPPAPLNLAATATISQITLTWSASVGATNYNVKRSTSAGGPYTIIGTTSGTSYIDIVDNTNVFNGSTNYYVVSAVNGGGESLNSAEASVYVPFPAVPTPQIGYVDFPATSTPIQYTSVFHPLSSATFNNDTYIVIKGTPGSQTFYTIDGSTPSITNGSTFSISSGYQDGIGSPAGLSPYLINQVAPSLTIKAVGMETNHPSSAVVSATFQFITANPTIIGNNAGQFYLSDITANANLYYTIDGSTPSPTNGVSLGTVATPTNLWTVGIPITTNTLFQVIAVRPNYQNSAVVSTTFSVSNFVANVISFGFGTGEASSDFVASPGQTFYAPVTLSPLSGVNMYTLQFNLTVNAGGTNAGPGITNGVNSGYGFSSMLLGLIPGTTPPAYFDIPPAMFVSTNTPNPYPVPVLGSTNFASLTFINTNLNLLGIGWQEAILQTNLYDTVHQDLITYSSAHNTLFNKSGGKVIVGGYAFLVPTTATNGQTYQIQIGRPTATSDGIGAPGSDVYIVAPTNGATAGGTPVNALKYVTVGQRKYIAGSVYPFRWFNAGDFGSSNLVSADVEQVFTTAIYALGAQGSAPGSDFYDAMDSCGNIGVVDTNPADANFGYYTNAGAYTNTYSLNNLFDGNDTTINQIAFGDGVIDVCDVYVTFRRSLDPSLTWFERFWNNGQRVADTNAPNVAAHLLKAPTSTVKPKVQLGSTLSPKVIFSAGDITNCSSGQVVHIPINATVFGNYPLRVLMLNLTVTPLDGSPALTTPVQFTQNAAVLGSPYITDSKGNGNYSAVWLNSTNAGLTGTATIGTLSVTLPAGVSTNSAYAIHFDHASASPNGLGSFPKQTFTGLITSTSRANSSYNDGVPDAWRLRWFGTVNNLLSASNACPSGDGISNWKKYVAGVDPTVANDFPSVNPKTPVPSGSSAAIHWPTVSGKQYLILSSASLFSGQWITNAIVTGTGSDMEFDDNTKGAVKFYRVQILP